MSDLSHLSKKLAKWSAISVLLAGATTLSYFTYHALTRGTPQFPLLAQSSIYWLFTVSILFCVGVYLNQLKTTAIKVTVSIIIWLPAAYNLKNLAPYNPRIYENFDQSYQPEKYVFILTTLFCAMLLGLLTSDETIRLLRKLKSAFTSLSTGT